MDDSPAGPHIVGRYALFDEIASGGMATVLLGRQLGAVGFARIVAIKRLQLAYVRDPDFVAMFLDEARIAARIRHANVVATIDIAHEADELFLVMEYVDGESLAALMRTMRARRANVPAPIAASILVGALSGLQAAHEARAEDGSPLGIVHRDVSPQNILVGADGVARVIDFGIARANVRLHQTRDGKVKGKLAYMAPEQISGGETSRAADIFATGIVLWELLAGDRVYPVDNEGALIARVLEGRVPPIRERAPWVSEPLAEVIARAVAKNPTARFASARDMARAIERAMTPASNAEVAEWVGDVAHAALAARAAKVSVVERFDRVVDEVALAQLTGRRSLPVPSPARAPTHLDAFVPAGKASATRTMPKPAVTLDVPRRRRYGVAVGAIAIAAMAIWLVVARPWIDETTAVLPNTATFIPVVSSPPPTPTPSVPTPTAPTLTLEAAPSPKPHPRRPVSSKPRAPAVQPLPACDVPTYQDADGITRVKRECLKQTP